MGKPEPQKQSTPSSKPDPSLADLLTKFKKNQEGNKRIQKKLNDIELKIAENANVIKDHIERYEDELSTIKSMAPTLGLTI